MNASRSLVPRTAVAACLCAALLPVEAAADLYPYTHAGHGVVQVASGRTLVMLTGVGMAAGESTGSAGALPISHCTGWLCAHRLIDRTGPPQIWSVSVDAVTPNAAVVIFTANKDVTSSVVYGPSIRYGGRRQGPEGRTVRMSGLEPGTFYHYQLTLRDEFGQTVTSDDLTFCTPSLDELVPRRLDAAFFADRSLSSAGPVRREATIDQPTSSDGNPDGDFSSGVGPDDFSVRWTGLFNATRAGAYTWHATANDGQRLFVDAERVVDDWVERDEAATTSFEQSLDRSWHAVSYEMFDAEGEAQALLELEGPSLERGPLVSASLASIPAAFYAPTIQPRDVPLVFECTSPQGVSEVLDPPEVYDCRDPRPSLRSDAPGTYLLGETRVVWTATNRHSQRSFWAEFVTVEDTRPPVAQAPDGVTAEAESPLGTPVELPSPAVEDACDPAPIVTWHLCENAGAPCQACFTAADEAANPSHAAGARDPSCSCEDAPPRFPLGTTPVNAFATDLAGNCADASFDVTIVDTTPPSIAMGSVELVCLQAPIPWVTVRDNATPAADLAVVCAVDGEAIPGSCDRVMELELGPHFVDYTATDTAGNFRTERLNFVAGNDDPTPPDLELVDAPAGFLGGPAQLSVRVTDNCDVAPDVSFAPAADSVAVAGNVHTATYSAEGVWSVDVTATDDAGSDRTLADAVFGIDLTAPLAGFVGLDPPTDPDDVLTWPVFFPGDVVSFRAEAEDTQGPANSGLLQVEVALTDLETDEDRVVHSSLYDAEGAAPAAGPLRIKNLLCVEDDPPEGDEACNGDGDLVVGGAGRQQLVVTATDQAGNSGWVARSFAVMTWPVAMEWADTVAGRLLAGNVSLLSRLMLQQLPDNLAEARSAAADAELAGNALLFSYTFVGALEFAASEGEDTGAASEWVAQGAFAAVRKIFRDAVDELGDDDPDLETADTYLADARDHLDSNPVQPLSSLLAAMNAYFYVRHGLDPFVIQDDVEAMLASRRLRDLVQEYQAKGAQNGADLVSEVAAEQTTIAERDLFEIVVGRDAARMLQANTAFLELLVRLVSMSELLADAQDNWVWTRSWQWPISLQVRVLSGIGLELAALQLGDDPQDPADPLLAEARTVYDEGVGLIDDRNVDEALDLYVDNRCLIHEVYNHAGFDPPAVPPDDWGCEECVTTGDCVH